MMPAAQLAQQSFVGAKERERVLKQCHQSPGQAAPAELSTETCMPGVGARVPRYKGEFKPATIE